MHEVIDADATWSEHRLVARRFGWIAVVLLQWVLIMPPDVGAPFDAFACAGCADPRYLDDAAPLVLWRKLGTFEHAVACRRARTQRMVAARDDREWSGLQLSRCVRKVRLYQGALRPGE